MNRRSFLRLLGIAPAAILLPTGMLAAANANYKPGHCEDGEYLFSGYSTTVDVPTSLTKINRVLIFPHDSEERIFCSMAKPGIVQISRDQTITLWPPSSGTRKVKRVRNLTFRYRFYGTIGE